MKTKVNIGKITEKDFITGIRMGSRNAEIELHGKPLSFSRTFRNKKKYNRKEKHKGVIIDSPF